MIILRLTSEQARHIKAADNIRIVIIDKPRKPTAGTVTLTQKQYAVLNYIAAYQIANGYPPALSEMAKYFGVSAPSISKRVARLIDLGYVTRDGNRKRSLRVVRLPGGVELERVA
jgi:DNA-binding MarR family transcriptional regulator